MREIIITKIAQKKYSKVSEIRLKKNETFDKKIKQIANIYIFQKNSIDK